MSRQCPVCSSSEVAGFCKAFDRVRNQPDRLWEILQCRRCKFGWTDPPLPESEIAFYYPPTYLGDTRRMIEEFKNGRLVRSRSWKKEREKVSLVERFSNGGRILDAGCAEGKFLWALDPANWQRYGVEFSENVVELVRSKIDGLELIAGDLYSNRLRENFFDVVTFWHVLEHLPDPRRVLNRVYSLLRPNGWLFISLPNLDSWQARWFRRHWYAFDDVPRHLYHFSPESIRMLLDETGFSVKRELFFSRIVNFHSWKYTLINWSEAIFGNRVPYYCLKPFLPGIQLVEGWSGYFGMLTVVARRC